MKTKLFRRLIMMCKVDSTHKDWKLLYLAAIGEKDNGVLPKRISDAQHAIFLREREIFYAGITLEDKEALEDALYALCALESAQRHSEVA
jgi:hypothetical protein